MRRDIVILNWLMIPALVVMALLLALALSQLSSRTAVPPESRPSGPLPTPHPAAEQTRQFFAWPGSVDWRPMTNAGNPFFTLAIQPAPPPKPPPPPPKTRKVDVTYRGFFETAAGLKRAVVQVADKQVLCSLGEKFLADYVAVEIGLRHLGSTNAAGTALKLEFAKTASVEIPAP
ncbi:MAG: hypothetical protein IT581_07730 [Verrucomicrobiales bacterium]|nr:hypothetical protein [Verrucomicrobiales bacterium]